LSAKYGQAKAHFGEISQFCLEVIVAVVGPALVEVLAFDHHEALVSQHEMFRSCELA